MKKADSGSAQTDIYSGYNAFKVGFVSDNLSHLMGEVLTVIDASVQGEQNKAMKDLIRRAFSDQQRQFQELSWMYEEADGNGHLPQTEVEKGMVPIVLGEVYSFEG